MADLRKSLVELAQQRFLETTQPLGDVVRKRLREYRKLRDLTQAELGNRMAEAGAPLTGDRISKMESGSRSVAIEELVRLADVLEVPLYKLLQPLDGEPHVRITDSYALEWHEVANWTVWGPESIPEHQAGRESIKRLRELAYWMQALREAKTERDKKTYSKKIRDVATRVAEAAQLPEHVIDRSRRRDEAHNAVRRARLKEAREGETR